MRKGVPTASGCARVALALLSALAMASLFPAGVLADEPTHFLEVSEDSFKIALISGNFTASVTKDIPRVVFLNSHALLSPTFVFSTAKIFLYNETDANGLFNESKVLYTGYLDQLHNEWNVSPVEFGNEPGSGECALVRIHKPVQLYEHTNESGDPKVPDWANVTFQFKISASNASCSTPDGEYVVAGRTEMRINISIEVLKPVPVKYIAIEQELRGGGSTNTFLLRQSDAGSPDGLVQVNSREDETVDLYNFAHPFRSVPGPMQEIYFAKDDRTVQAQYRFSSTPMNGTGGEARPVPINTSYYTTGTSLMLHQSFALNDSTDRIIQEMTLGIDESGFLVKVKDWFSRNLPMLMVVLGSITIIITVPLTFVVYKKHFSKGGPKRPDGKA